MTPKDIGQAYDQITYLWTRPEFNRNNGIAEHKQALSFLHNKETALDVGCGCTGRFIDLLISEGLTPEGVDVSKEMLNLAKQKHPDLVFHHQDICQWQPSKKYDFISAWDSIWHIPLTEQTQVIGKLVASLNSKGVFIFSFGGTDEPAEHCDDAMGVEVYYSSLGTNGFLQLIRQLGCQIKYLGSEPIDLHCYLIVQKN